MCISDHHSLNNGSQNVKRKLKPDVDWSKINKSLLECFAKIGEFAISDKDRLYRLICEQSDDMQVELNYLMTIVIIAAFKREEDTYNPEYK